LSQRAGANERQERERVESLEGECEALISKVYFLKERELHVRSVVLQLLKVLELRSMRKETEGIVSVICELFEYSES
jgi:hypothetical protein